MGKIEKKKTGEKRDDERERNEEGGQGGGVGGTGEGKAYSSDRQNTIRVALRTAIVGSAMTGLLLIPGEK